MPTLPTLRRSFSKNRLHKYKQMTSGVQASPPSGSYAGVADTSDAQRVFVSSDLASTSITDGEAIRSDYYDGWYLYLLVATPEQRRVAMSGYFPNNSAADVTDQAGTSIVGYVMLERSWGAIVPATTVGELHALPVLDDGMSGIHAYLNQALRSMRNTRTITLTPNGTRRIEITSQAWLTKQSMLGRVLGPASSYVNAMDGTTVGECKLQFDGEKTYLILPYGPGSTDGSLYAECFAPRSSWIRVSGAWAISTAGLVNETDECTGDENEITLVAYYHYLTAQLMADPRGASPNMLREWKMVAEAAAPFMVYDQDALVPVHDPSGPYGMPDSPAWRAFRGQSFAKSGFGGWP